MVKWKLLSGVHHDKNAKPVKLADLEGVERGNHTFYAGDVFESDRDLDAHNVRDSVGRPISVRFALVDEETGDDLDTKTVTELLEFASQEEIELPEKKLPKGQLLRAIRGALLYRQAVS